MAHLTRRGTFYWDTFAHAQAAADEAPAREARHLVEKPIVRSYLRGYAVQACPSGPYLGPGGWV